MAEQTCAVCGMGGHWVAYDPTTKEDRCVNHIGQDHQIRSERASDV